jgi:hypothetical protein
MTLIAKLEEYILQLEGAVNQLQQENRILKEQIPKK